MTPAASQALAHQLDDLGGAAFEHHDGDTFARETFPVIIDLAGGRDKFMAQMRASFAQMDAQHVKIVSHVSNNTPCRRRAGP